MTETADIESGRRAALQRFRWIDGHADSWTMLANGESLKAIVHGLAELAREQRPDLIVGIEARGWALGPAVAVALGVGFTPIRKKGALFPGEVAQRETAADYRGHRWTLTVRRDLIASRSRVVLIDDWIETGTQALTAAKLIAECGGDHVAVVVVIDEASSDARSQLPPIHALVTSTDLP